MREGKGVFKLNDGKVYEGEFKNDKMEGKRVLKCTNGDVYEGGFKN